MKPKTYFFIIVILVAAFSLLIGKNVQANEACDCFPHPSNWENINQHGVVAFEHGANPYCTECHATDLSGGWTEVGCKDCHEAYPHENNWEDINKHGVYADEHGVVESCQTECHGEDYKGGYSEIDCFECHEVYPHDEKWKEDAYMTDKDYHGAYVMKHDSIKERTCATECHGGGYAGGVSGKDCFECHQSYPHAFNWSAPESHGIYSVTFGTEENCSNTCHGNDYSGGETEVGCYDCHESFPHESNYEQNHESMAEEDLFQCGTLCHGSNLTGGLSGYSCTQCHGEWSPYPTFINRTQDFFNWLFF